MNLSRPEADYAVPTAPQTVRIQRTLPGPIEHVWEYLTQGELRRKWLASGAMPAQVGAPFMLTWRNDELTDPPGHKPEGFGSEHTMESNVLAARLAGSQPTPFWDGWLRLRDDYDRLIPRDS